MIKKNVLITLIVLAITVSLNADESDWNPILYWDGTYCYIDTQGNIQLQGPYEEAYKFNNELARVKIDGKYVFINKEGNVVIDLPTNAKDDDAVAYNIQGDFSDGLGLVHIQSYNKRLDGEGFINTRGELVISSTADYDSSIGDISDFSNGFALIYKNDLYGYINTEGKEVIEAKYKEAYNFSDGLARVKFPNTNKYGYINEDGKVVIRPEYTKAYDFSDGLALVKIPDTKIDYHYGFINQIGELVIDCVEVSKENKNQNEKIYSIGEDINQFYDGIAVLGHSPARDENGTHLFLNTKGEVKFKLDLTGFSIFNSGRAFVSQNVKTYDYDRENQSLYVKHTRKNWGIIDTDGEYVVPLQYEWYPVSVFSNGIAKVKDRETGKVQYINTNGDIIYTE